jgi:AraC-like DNA-binding protein
VQATPLPTIQVAATAGILEFVAKGGGDVASVVRQASLTLDELACPEGRLPLRKFVTLIEAASRATGDDCFGAHLGEVCGLNELGLPGYLATFAPTVEEALSSFSRYYYLLGDATEVRFDRCGEQCAFSYRVLDPESWPRRQDAEQVLTMVVFLLRDWIGAAFRPTLVCFEHDEPRDAAEIARIVGCRVRFGCDTNAVWLAATYAQSKNPRADARLFRLLSWFAETTITGQSAPLHAAGTFREQVLASIDACVNLGNATTYSVARALGLEARTFQRRLRAEQTSFRELFEEYRERHAAKLLEQPRLSEKEIAARLGYGSLNAFIRAFRRWNGLTPGQFRGRHALA